jgi:hypothetical protein
MRLAEPAGPPADLAALGVGIGDPVVAVPVDQFGTWQQRVEDALDGFALAEVEVVSSPSMDVMANRFMSWSPLSKNFSV